MSNENIDDDNIEYVCISHYLVNLALTEIKGLESMTHFQHLFLNNNRITEIK